MPDTCALMAQLSGAGHFDPRLRLNGSLIGSGGSIVDVTDDVQAVKALEASERKFRML